MGKKKASDYALYKGDNLIMIGKAREICNVLDIGLSTFYKYASKNYKEKVNNLVLKNNKTPKRLIAIAIEEESNGI